MQVKCEENIDECSQMGGFGKRSSCAPVNPKTGSSGWVSFAWMMSKTFVSAVWLNPKVHLVDFRSISNDTHSKSHRVRLLERFCHSFKSSVIIINLFSLVLIINMVCLNLLKQIRSHLERPGVAVRVLFYLLDNYFCKPALLTAGDK